MQELKSKYLRTPLYKPQITAKRELKVRSKLDKYKREIDQYKESKFYLLELNQLRRRLGYLVNRVENIIQVIVYKSS